MTNFQSVEKDPLSRSQEFNDYYNMFRAVNIALTLILAYLEQKNISVEQIVLDFLSKYNPEGKELYSDALLRHRNEVLTCINYVDSLQGLDRLDGQIYIADIPDSDGLHFVYVFTIDGQRYYLEPHMNSDQMIKIEKNQVVGNKKYKILIEFVNGDLGFTSEVSIATGRSMRYEFRCLEIPDYAKDDYMGYLTLKHHLSPKTQVYLSRRDSNRLEAIALKNEQELVFILPYNGSEIEDLKEGGIDCSLNRLSYRFSLKLQDLETIKDFIMTKFTAEIYDDLIEFRANTRLLGEVQSCYSVDMHKL
jgi:hypothetical protein